MIKIGLGIGSRYFSSASGGTPPPPTPTPTPPPPTPTPPPPTPTPPPPSPTAYTHELGYSISQVDSCTAYPTQSYYSDSQNLAEYSRLYTDIGLATAVSDGYYSNGGFNYYTSNGVISTVSSCNVYPHDLGYSVAAGQDSCIITPRTTYYSNVTTLSIGAKLFTSEDRTSYVQNGYYSDGVLIYYVASVGVIGNINNCA